VGEFREGCKNVMGINGEGENILHVHLNIIEFAEYLLWGCDTM
jgi:hypothetical protein